MEGCGGGGNGGWPEDLGDALATCPNLEHLTLLLRPLPPPQQSGDCEDVVMPLSSVCGGLTSLTQIRSLTFELGLPSSSANEEPYGSGAAVVDAEAGTAVLARGMSALRRLSRLEICDGGSLPHPEWRLELLHSLAGLPRLEELIWRRLEYNSEVAFMLASSSFLTLLSVEKFRTVAPVAAVTLAATTIGAAHSEPEPDNVPPPSRVVAAAAAAAAVSTGGVTISLVRSGRTAVGLGGGGGVGQHPRTTQQQQLRLLLLPLPPHLRLLRARYSGLGGMSLAALAALQLPQSLTSLELRNPKLEIADGDVDQPAAARLLPEAALAIALGIAKLAAHCPDLKVLRIINETTQRNALAAPVGWAEAHGGDGGAAGGGHAPWLASLGQLRQLRQLTLSGLMLGRVDAETLARHVTALEVRT